MRDQVTVDPASPRASSWRITARVAAAALIASALAPAWLTGAPSPARAADESTYATASTFELVPESGLVHVTVVLTIHNGSQSTSVTRQYTPYAYNPCIGAAVPYPTTCTETTSYYVNSSAVVVDPEGTNFRATTPGAAASVSVKSGGEGFLSTATLSFPRILAGKTRAITVTYDMIGGAPRSDAYTRAGRAYARFCGFLAGAYLGTVDSMRLVVPSAYAVTQYYGRHIFPETEGGSTVLEVPATVHGEDSDLSETCVEAVDTDAYVGTHLTSDSGVKLEINAWPEDGEWLATISDAASGALDDLEAAIGHGPAVGSVTVEEVATETLGGYGGTADVTAQLVRISETAIDPVTAVHEMAHLWFNEQFSLENWLTEGYAEYFARLLTPGEPDCGRPSADVLDGIDLGNWAFLPRLPTDEDHATVLNQYDTACWLVTEIEGRMSADAIQEIYAAALGSEIAYVGDGAPEKVPFGNPILWRGFLDIVDERLITYDEADQDWLQDLLASVRVATSPSELAARSDARAAYHQMLADADPWAAPYVVRLRMSEWSFDAAQAAIATAAETAALHRDATEAVGELSESTTVERAFEEAKDEAELDDARDLATAELKATRVVADAVAAAHAGRGPLDAIGLLGDDLVEDADAAVESLVDGDLDTATTDAESLLSTSAGATLAGGLRLGGSAVVLLGGSGAVLLIRRRQARRVESPVPAHSPEIEDPSPEV